MYGFACVSAPFLRKNELFALLNVISDNVLYIFSKASRHNPVFCRLKNL